MSAEHVEVPENRAGLVKNLLIKTSCIRETLNLSTCADGSTNTKTDRKKHRKKRKRTCHMSGVQYQVSSVKCHASHVTCYMSRVRCHPSPVTCHQQPQPQKLPLLTPPEWQKDRIKKGFQSIRKGRFREGTDNRHTGRGTFQLLD